MPGIYDNNDFFQAYAKMSRSQQGLEGAGEWHQLRPLLPPLKDIHMLDLGCGYGWHCRYAADCGASSIVGIDQSHRMIEEARLRNAHPRIQYQLCNLEQYAYPENAFDLVLSSLVLHYVEDLSGIFHQVYQTLKNHGIFVFSIEHPVFTSGVHQEWIRDSNGNILYWPVDRYFEPGPRETVFLGKTVTKQHHTLTQILMGLLQAGFQLQAVEEAQPDPKMLHLEGMADELRRPMMLLVRAVKEQGNP